MSAPLLLILIDLKDCAPSGGAGGWWRRLCSLEVSYRVNPGCQRFLLALSGISKAAVFDSSRRGAATTPPPDSISCLRWPSRGRASPGKAQDADTHLCRAKTKAKWHEGGCGGGGGNGLQWLLKASCPFFFPSLASLQAKSTGHAHPKDFKWNLNLYLMSYNLKFIWSFLFLSPIFVIQRTPGCENSHSGSSTSDFLSFTTWQSWL